MPEDKGRSPEVATFVALGLLQEKSSLILSESRLVNMLNTLKWLTWSDSKNNIIWLEAAK